MKVVIIYYIIIIWKTINVFFLKKKLLYIISKILQCSFLIFNLNYSQSNMNPLLFVTIIFLFLKKYHEIEKKSLMWIEQTRRKKTTLKSVVQVNAIGFIKSAHVGNFALFYNWAFFNLKFDFYNVECHSQFFVQKHAKIHCKLACLSHFDGRMLVCELRSMILQVCKSVSLTFLFQIASSYRLIFMGLVYVMWYYLACNTEFFEVFSKIDSWYQRSARLKIQEDLPVHILGLTPT